MSAREFETVTCAVCGNEYDRTDGGLFDKAKQSQHLRIMLANGWTPVSEPPDDEMTVLLFDPKQGSDQIWPGFKSGAEWCWADGSTANPTHWRDFPEPPIS